jgi:hypothetical protein
VRAIDSGSKFVGVCARVPEPAALEAIQSADVIVGCVDTLQARAHIQEAAWRNLVPYVDVGVGIRSLKSNAMEPRVSIGGNILVLLPGGFCMWCCGFLSDENLDAERGGLPATYFQNKKGQAQVVSFNGVVASQAVSEVLQLLTAYRGTSLNPASLRLRSGHQRGFLKHDGVRGTIEDWGAMRSATCPCCDALLGSGSVLWTAPATKL